MTIYFAKETYNFKEPTNRSHPILTPPGLASSSRLDQKFSKVANFPINFSRSEPLKKIVSAYVPQDDHTATGLSVC